MSFAARMAETSRRGHVSTITSAFLKVHHVEWHEPEYRLTGEANGLTQSIICDGPQYGTLKYVLDGASCVTGLRFPDFKTKK
jgi:hypothetical protein